MTKKPEIVKADDDYHQHTGEVAQSAAVAPMGLFGTTDPAEVIDAAEAHAEALTSIIEKRELYSDIKGRRHVRVEGWTLLGSMVGVFPVTTWTRKLDNGWEARVEARTLTGAIVGAAESQCLRSESTWADRDDYALRSMAQTRATAKALRLPLGFIVQLAGFDATPAEEMPHDGSSSSAPSVGKCPVCHGDVWDNREKRATGWGGPAFRCKNRVCTGVDDHGAVLTEGKAGEPWVTWHEGYFAPPTELPPLPVDFDEAMSGFTGDEIPGDPSWDELQSVARRWLIERCRAAGADAKAVWAEVIASADLPPQAQQSPPPELFLELVRQAGELAPMMAHDDDDPTAPFDRSDGEGY